MSSAAGSVRAGGALAWSVLVVLVTVIAVGAAFAPVAITTVIVCLSIATITLTRYGLVEGTWYLLLFTLPLREPLGYDILGTRTLYASDVILHLLALIVILRAGVAGVWRESPTLKIGTAILVISAIGLYARSDAPSIVAIHRIIGQLVAFFLARHIVRDARSANRTILWFLGGMVPAILYGLYQASIPLVGASYPTWAKVPIAYDAAGVPHIRVFSTFDHTLHFSQALSMTFGIAVALLLTHASRAVRWFALATAILAGVCNQLTYSVSGIVGTGAAMVIAVLGQRRRWLALALPILAAVSILIAPQALFERVSHLLTGRSISTVVRVLTYKEGFRTFLDHPITGVGWGGIPSLREEFVSQKSLPPAPENYFLHRAVSTGAPGLLLFLALVILFLRNGRRARGIDPAWPRLAVWTGGLTYFAQGMFFPGESYTNNYALWILLALAERMAREAPALPERPPGAIGG